MYLCMFAYMSSFGSWMTSALLLESPQKCHPLQNDGKENPNRIGSELFGKGRSTSSGAEYGQWQTVLLLTGTSWKH